MTDYRGAGARLKEALSLSSSRALLAFCDDQRRYIDQNADEEQVRASAVNLAREARRRRLSPESVLLAMQLGGCYRSCTLYSLASDLTMRYFRSLRMLLASYFGSESRPAERRLAPRLLS